ncbi:E3 ubiquitin/ISG15 ligase TRIM25-like [Limanda limanda]|uniref:E3 ubiquitin/ISG15 ligase TRIM25-like n=1 Tax=Limanda limanda TaxID=27771 RepID=UPI0029C77A5C|nr:E3 ubiquitin/ISG15 ligase TRIM25-like [Limanda limanda]
MAESCGSDMFQCSICLDGLNHPVTLHCGHSFCQECMNTFWDQDNQKGVYTCPQCVHSFNPRPVLGKNIVLEDAMGKMSKEAAAAAEGDEVVPGDVACDVCTVRRLKAVKSCLVCLASYCSTHLQPHYQSAAFKRHKLVEVSVSMQDQICPKHDKLLEVFCRSDGHCICLLCVMDEHRSHDTVSAAAEREDRQKQFPKKERRYHRGIREKLKKLKKLRQNIASLKCSGDAAVQEADRVYTESVRTADMKLRAVKRRIRVEEKAGVSQAGVLVDRLEREISELRKRKDSLKQLSLTEDHIHFLQSSQPIFNCPEPDESPDHRVEWKGPRVEVAMCYKGSELQEKSFGYTDQSWSISLSTSSCSFWHNEVKTRISVPCSVTVGVYLNHEAGSLSFYSVSDSGQMRLLHRVQTTFSKPLYPGFMVSRGSSVQIRAQK